MRSPVRRSSRKMTHLNPPCIGRTYKITLLFNPKMTLKPNSLPKQGGTGWVSHLNYEKERNLEIHHSDADSDSDGHRHHARRHLVHDVVVSPTTKENLPTLFYRGREVSRFMSALRAEIFQILSKIILFIFVRFLAVGDSKLITALPYTSACHTRKPRRSR